VKHMIGGKGKGRCRAVSLLVEELRRARRVEADADAAIERWMMRGESTDSDRQTLVAALVAAEAKVRSGVVVLARDSDGHQEGADGQ
jgi:hypothetical protein